MSEPTADELRAQLAELDAKPPGIAEVAATLARDRTTLRRSNIVSIVAAVVVAIALGGVIAGQQSIQHSQQSIQDTQAEFSKAQDASAERGKRIERSSVETHQLSVTVACIIEAGRKFPASPARRNAFYDECKASDGKLAAPTTTTT